MLAFFGARKDSPMDHFMICNFESILVQLKFNVADAESLSCL